MKKKNSDIEKICEKCEFSIPICDELNVLCEKRGVVPIGHSCRKFMYDPLKRNPGKIPGIFVPDEETFAEIADVE